MIAILASAMDIAGMEIRRQLLKNYGFTDTGEKFDGFPVYTLPIEHEEARLFTISTDSIHAEGIDKRIPAGLFVFATRHVSKAGVPALTTHSVGNWEKADFGGKDGTVCPTSATLLKLFIQNLDAVAKSENYAGEVVQESTHHGPYLEKPAVFIEVGSTEKEWKDEKLASMVADSLIGGLVDYVTLENKFIPVVCLGGLHYAEGFRKLMLETDYAVGHVCPKHHLSGLTMELLQQAMKSCGARELALDWKGLGGEKERILRLLESGRIGYVRV